MKPTQQRDQSLFAALDIYNAHYSNTQYREVSAIIAFNVPGDHIAHMNMVIDAAMEICGSEYHQGAIIRLFSAIGAHYYASLVTFRYLAQFVV